MKKMMLWLCLMMIVPTLASADMVSISELRQQAEAVGRWTQTYEAHGRTIEVDVPIIVPEVNEFPVFSVEPYYAVYEQRLESATLKVIEIANIVGYENQGNLPRFLQKFMAFLR